MLCLCCAVVEVCSAVLCSDGMGRAMLSCAVLCYGVLSGAD